MIQIVFLLLGIVVGSVMFAGWFQLPHIVLMILGGGMAILFLFEQVTKGQSRQTTVAFSATLLFFGLAFSSWIHEIWPFDAVLPVLLMVRVSLILTVVGVAYLVFVYNQWLISYYGRRGNLKEQEKEPTFKRRFEEWKRQRELDKQGLPTVFLGTVEEIEKKGYYKY
ncbi:hypothetical protein GCM10007416_31780 [Kroppenstedtia guangzhouensis]|uniref:Uncharacterized protein n=1 Tax=Kroppenstedtia guangzhouensis TaxID=1274356 RepID=A0ABQ1H2B0_9BACL|nr:hypothetical protein [Kroppenstedtia guangzhouensis]GGA56232.1 hypothetical protein GCM10007416_31780 [Kroppenstedtia guangzhouensis]